MVWENPLNGNSLAFCIIHISEEKYFAELFPIKEALLTYTVFNAVWIFTLAKCNLNSALFFSKKYTVYLKVWMSMYVTDKTQDIFFIILHMWVSFLVAYRF